MGLRPAGTKGIIRITLSDGVIGDSDMRQITLLSLGLAITLSPSVPMPTDAAPFNSSFAQKLESLQNAMRSGELTIAQVPQPGSDPTEPHVGRATAAFYQLFSQAFSQFSQQFSQFSNMPYCGYGGRC